MPSKIFRMLEKVRNLLEMKNLWGLVGAFGFRGRCWGLKSKGKNPFTGSHIILCNGDSLVDLFQRVRDGKLTVLQFVPAEDDTELGMEIKLILFKSGYDFEEEVP